MRSGRSVASGLSSAKRNKAHRIERGFGIAARAALDQDQPLRVRSSAAQGQDHSATRRELRLKNLRLAHGDGAAGLEKAAPFDSIILAAAAPELPQALLRQLAPGGRMILPLRDGGADAQRLVLVERGARGYTETALDPVRFVPLRAGKA